MQENLASKTIWLQLDTEFFVSLSRPVTQAVLACDRSLGTFAHPRATCVEKEKLFETALALGTRILDPLIFFHAQRSNLSRNAAAPLLRL